MERASLNHYRHIPLYTSLIFIEHIELSWILWHIHRCDMNRNVLHTAIHHTPKIKYMKEASCIYYSFDRAFFLMLLPLTYRIRFLPVFIFVKFKERILPTKKAIDILIETHVLPLSTQKTNYRTNQMNHSGTRAREKTDIWNRPENRLAFAQNRVFSHFKFGFFFEWIKFFIWKTTRVISDIRI